MLEITPKKLQLKEFILIIGLILIVVVFGVYLINKKISKLANQIQDQKSQIVALQNREENFIELQKNYYEIESKINVVSNILPDEENVVLLVSYLENLVKKNGVNLELVFNDKINLQVEQNKSLAFDINLSGAGEAIKDTWKSLEKGPYFITISDFSLSTVSGLGSDSKLKLTGKVFTNDPYKIMR